MALQITTLTKISDFSEFIINYRGHASFVITTAGISTYVRIFTRKESMDRLIMLEVGKLRARVSGCLCLVMEGDCRGWGGEMHLCVVPGLRYLPPGAVSTSQQAAWPVQHPITDHSSRRAHTSHITLSWHETHPKYQRKLLQISCVCAVSWRSSTTTSPRWHLFLLAANLRQNFFQTFFVVKTQPAGGAWVRSGSYLLMSQFSERGVCFSPSPPSTNILCLTFNKF